MRPAAPAARPRILPWLILPWKLPPPALRRGNRLVRSYPAGTCLLLRLGLRRRLPCWQPMPGPTAPAVRPRRADSVPPPVVLRTRRSGPGLAFDPGPAFDPGLEGERRIGQAHRLLPGSRSPESPSTGGRPPASPRLPRRQPSPLAPARSAPAAPSHRTRARSWILSPTVNAGLNPSMPMPEAPLRQIERVSLRRARSLPRVSRRRHGRAITLPPPGQEQARRDRYWSRIAVAPVAVAPQGRGRRPA